MLEEGSGAIQRFAIGGEGVQHVALGVGDKEELLIVLAVNVTQMGRQILEEGDGDRPAADERARFSAGQDFAFHQQFPSSISRPEGSSRLRMAV
ncbi:MAG: hypothetical protein WDO73_36575 [Ignavibacteriota bacterium]